MAVVITNDHSAGGRGDLFDKQAQLNAAVPGSPLQKQLAEELVRGCVNSGRLSAAQIIATLQTAAFAISGLAVATGTTGQMSCSASPVLLAVGQRVTIAWAGSGTGAIAGYSNPTTYLVSATNGSTTFTITTLAGGVVSTTAGTMTSATGAVTGPLISAAWLAAHHPEIALLTASIAANPNAVGNLSALNTAQIRAVDDAMAANLISANNDVIATMS